MAFPSLDTGSNSMMNKNVTSLMQISSYLTNYNLSVLSASV